MANLTTKELAQLEDQLSYEQLLVKKFKSYSQDVTDPALKTKCNQIASKHQDHFNRLVSYLN